MTPTPRIPLKERRIVMSDIMRVRNYLAVCTDEERPGMEAKLKELNKKLRNEN